MNKCVNFQLDVIQRCGQNMTLNSLNLETSLHKTSLFFQKRPCCILLGGGGGEEDGKVLLRNSRRIVILIVAPPRTDYCFGHSNGNFRPL